jgi:hypothetical protein
MKERLAKMESSSRAMREQPSDADMQRLIAEAAYYRSERRGFQPGQEIEDWIAAEAEVRARMRGGQRLL